MDIIFDGFEVLGNMKRGGVASFVNLTQYKIFGSIMSRGETSVENITKLNINDKVIDKIIKKIFGDREATLPFALDVKRSWMNNVLGFALNLSHDWLKKELKKEKLSDKFGAEALLAGVMENKITIIASGLMRLYRFRNQRIELLKGEQSYARFKNYEGAVSGKNIAMSLIGASDSIDPQIFEETVFPNDIYLFLSYPAYADIPVEKARKELSLLSGSHPREEEKRLLKQAVRRILGEIRYQNDRDNLSLGLAKIL